MSSMNHLIKQAQNEENVEQISSRQVSFDYTEMSQLKTIIGFDLGHGETALAKVQVLSTTTPEMLEIYGRKSQMTVVGKDSKGEVMIGQRALEVADVSELDISFKQRPNNDPHYRSVMITFVQAVVENLTKTGQLTLSPELRFVVGCPSGWKPAVREAYATFISEMGLGDVKVVQESRAAFMYAVDRHMFSVEELKTSVLVIDIGSSTTDFTLVQGMEDTPIDDEGDDIGATYLDRVIFEYTLEQQQDKNALKELFARSSFYRNRCEILCRKAKEKYFSNPEWYVDTQYKAIEDIQGQYLFRVALDKAAVDAILTLPIEKFGGRNFPDAFEHVVRKVYQRLEAEHLMPKVVLLTGGPSRIGFIQDICEKVFAGVKPKRDTEPEYTIARGLALYGKSVLRINSFRQELQSFTQNQLPSLIAEQLPQLSNYLAEPLSDALLENALKPAQRAWCNGDIDTLEQLPSHVQSNAKEYFNTPEAKQLLRKQVEKWFAPVKDQINANTQAISQQYAVPAEVLELDIHYRPDEIHTGDLTETETNLSSLVLGGFSAVTIISTLITFTLLDAFNGFIFSVPLLLMVGAIAAFRGRDAANEWVQRRNIRPIALRKRLLTAEQIDNPKPKVKKSLEASIRKSLEQDKNLATKITEQASQQLSQVIEAKADEASIFVR